MTATLIHDIESPVAVASSGLDPFDRMLLTADGTVTTLVEACTGEPITTRTVRQTGPATLEWLLATTGRWWQPDAGLLELGPAEQVIVRRVILCGARSRVANVLAESLVVPGRMPGLTADRIVRAGASIGRLLAAGSYETRREVLQITAARAGAASDHLGVGPSATLARRTYRIVLGGQAAVLVSEWLSPGRLTSTALAPGVP